MRFLLSHKLPFKHTLVYSFGIYRQHKGQSATVAEIADTFRMLPQTVKNILSPLNTVGLVSVNDNNLTFADPTAAHFKWTKAECPQYFSMTLDIKSNASDTALIGLLKSLCKQGRTQQTSKGLATLLHLDRTSIMDAVGRLCDDGLLDIKRRKGGFDIVSFGKPKPVPLAAPVAPAVSAPAPAVAPVSPVVPVELPVWQKYYYSDYLSKIMAEDPGNRWLQSEFPNEATAILVDKGISKETFLVMLSNARDSHNKTGTSPTCAYLLLKKLKEASYSPDMMQEQGSLNPFERYDRMTPEERKAEADERERKREERIKKEDEERAQNRVAIERERVTIETIENNNKL